MKTLPKSIDENSVAASDKALGWKRLFLVLLVLAVVLLLSWVWKMPLSGRGGLPVPGELVIEVPQFFQADPRWGSNHLGETTGTLAAEGCALSSAAMVLGFYGMDVDPKRLNNYLNEHHGYEGKGWLKWESAALFSPGMIRKAYEDLPSYALIDWNLLHGNPVIVRVRLWNGITHFVVIVGKRGFDYLIRNPAGWSRADGGEVYPFVRLGVPIEALRYYTRLE